MSEHIIYYFSHLWPALWPPHHWISSGVSGERECRQNSWWPPCWNCLCRRRCSAARRRPSGGPRVWGDREAPPGPGSPSAAAPPVWLYRSRNTGAGDTRRRWISPGPWGDSAWRWPPAGWGLSSADLCGWCPDSPCWRASAVSASCRDPRNTDEPAERGDRPRWGPDSASYEGSRRGRDGWPWVRRSAGLWGPAGL